MAFEIVTDTGCNLSEEMIDELGIHILPLHLYVEGKEYVSYIKGEKVDYKVFYDMMRDGKMITTSLPSMAYAKEVFEEILNRGNDVLYIGFSSGLSGTYQAAAMEMQELQAAYPERKLLSVDTYCAALGQGLIVKYACDKRDEGASIEEVQQWTIDNRLKMCHWFTVDDLMHLFHGGRVSRSSAWAGTLLNIKPVLHVDNEGKLIPMEKIRGRKKSLQALVKHLVDSGVDLDNQYIGISHGDCIEDAEYVKELVLKECNPKGFIINLLEPVVGGHTGPGLVALFFMGNER